MTVTGQSRPIDLYSYQTPNGVKIAIMLEECGLPFVSHVIDITKGEQHSPAFTAISPNNKIPVIVDPEGPGGEPITIFESGAILQYLGRKTGKFYPSDERARVEVDQWLHWQIGGLGPMGGQAHHYLRYAKEKVPYAIARVSTEMARLYGVMDRRLSDRDFLAGDYSIADIACFGWVRRANWQGQNLNDFPHVKEWFARIADRPAVKRALAGGF